jgi:hypothetical protein
MSTVLFAVIQDLRVIIVFQAFPWFPRMQTKELSAPVHPSVEELSSFAFSVMEIV